MFLTPVRGRAILIFVRGRVDYEPESGGSMPRKKRNFLSFMLGADAYETHYIYRYGPTQVLGRVWSVVELGEWFGTWTRRGDSNVFDAAWTNKNTPGEWRDELILESFEGRCVVLFRRGMNGPTPGRCPRTASPSRTRPAGTSRVGAGRVSSSEPPVGHAVRPGRASFHLGARWGALREGNPFGDRTGCMEILLGERRGTCLHRADF